MDLGRSIASVPARLGALRGVAGSGLLRPTRPDRVLGAAVAVARWGLTAAAGSAAGAARFPNRPAVVDELGSLSFAELDRHSTAIANAMAERGIGEGDGLAIMCRNSRWFVEAAVAASKLGANAVLVNTGFGGPQLADVLGHEGARGVVYDEEFAPLVEARAPERVRFVGWHDGPAAVPSLRELATGGSPAARRPPRRPGRVVILTSGTTGTPRGATRGTPRGLDSVLALFGRVPLRIGEPALVAAPLFHAWGLANLTIAQAMGSPVVLQRRFDPEATLAAVARHGVTTVAVVPVMLQRILALGPEVAGRYDTSSLRVVASSGAGLPGDLALRWMDAFGDNLYNLYGSTEVAWATIATPADLRAAPGTAGRSPLGAEVRVCDDAGRPLPAGATGRIFVGSDLRFEGYTGGGGKETIDGLLSTGDVGHFDEAGRLFVDGREDDMVVSGGENVFPAEVEGLLAGDPAVADVAVVGVEDSEFGQRLKAFVVRRAGATVSEAALKARVRSRSARYKVPREVVFVDELPRNATGKVDRRRLRDAPSSSSRDRAQKRPDP